MNAHRKRGNFVRQARPGPFRAGLNVNAAYKGPFRSSVTHTKQFVHERLPLPPPPPPPLAPVSRMAVSKAKQMTATEQAKHKKEPEIVNVPEASKFFTQAASTRSAIFETLNLNSLFEYVEHLEEYRKANWEKVATFHKQYQVKMRDPDNAEPQGEPQLSNGDSSKQRVSELLEDVEKKLESFQLKRMLAKGIDGVHNIDLGNGQSSGQEHTMQTPTVEVVDLTFREEIDLLNQRKENQEEDGTEELNGSKNVKKLPPIFEEDKVEDFSSGTFNSLLPSEKGSSVDEDNEELKIKFDSFPVAEEQSASDDSSALKLIEETLEKVTKSLDEEVSLLDSCDSVQPEKSTVSSADGNLSTAEGSIPSSKSIQGSLSIEGHQLPLPRHFNRLSPVEQNFLLVSLPEEIRATYLNLAWEARFYEHLASKPIALKQQLLLSLQM